MPRRYVPDYTDAGISRERYWELLHFARQYPEWLKASASLLGASGQSYEPAMRPGGSVSDPTLKAVSRRERYLNKITLVESAAREAGGEEWYSTLIANVCRGYPLYTINPTSMPTSNRNAYYLVRRAFFIILDQMLT